MSLIHQLVSHAAWDRHAAAMAADPSLQRAMAGVLLEHCLPATAAEVVEGEVAPDVHQGGSGVSVVQLAATVLGHGSLVQAVRRQLQSSTTAAAAVGHCMAVLRALPTTRPSGMQAADWSSDAAAAATLLAICCGGLVIQVAGAYQGEAGSSGSGAQTNVPAESVGAAAAAAWQLVGLLPQLMATIAGLGQERDADGAFPDGFSSWLDNLHSMCGNLSVPLQLLHILLHVDCTVPQLTSWLQAATASVRLLPCLSRLDAQLQQGRGTAPNGAQRLSRAVWKLFAQISLPRVQASSSSAEDPLSEQTAAWDRLLEQLWAQHTTQCRLIHALTAAVAPLRLPGVQLAVHDWHGVLWRLNILLLLSVTTQGLRQQLDSTASILYLVSMMPRRVQLHLH